MARDRSCISGLGGNNWEHVGPESQVSPIGLWSRRTPPPPSPGRASGPSPGARQPACSPVGLAFWALLRGSWASVVCPLRCFLSFLCGYPLLSSLSHKAPILGIPGGKTSPEGSSPGGILSRRHLPGRPDSWRCWAGLSSEVIDLLWVTQQKGLVKSVNHPTWSVWG